MPFRLTAPACLLALSLVVAVTLLLLPERHFDTAKGAAGEALRPGQQAVLRLRAWAGSGVGRLKSHFDTARALAESERRRKQLEKENRRLRAELQTKKNRPGDVPEKMPEGADQPLLAGRCVNARVLGHQAKAFLVDQQILDVGLGDGVRRDALVVDSPESLIDQGCSAGVEADQLVLSQGRVWGKVVGVGPETSTVRTVTEPGYRDLVRLADPSGKDGPLRLGPEGILEGTGEPLARIRLVEVTEPVSVGDAVYSAGGAGILPRPLLYGHVARVERPVGAAHWEIWMQPAAGISRPQQVAVLRAELNPARIARKEKF